jgi:hypothetical protein
VLTVLPSEREVAGEGGLPDDMRYLSFSFSR